MPAVCRHYIVETTATGGHAPQSSHAPLIISAMIFLVFFALFIFCCYRRHLKREMYKQMVRDVNVAVSQYIAFKEDGNTDDVTVAEKA